MDEVSAGSHDQKTNFKPPDAENPGSLNCQGMMNLLLVML
jgi:hypothetical protein